MGIQGLLDQVTTQPVALTQLSGCSFVIDGHCLLHKFAYRHAVEYVMQDKVNGIVSSLVSALKPFITASSHTILIFDGGMLPSKAMTNFQRQEQRQKALQQAIAAQNAGQDLEYKKFIAQAIHFPREKVIEIANQVVTALRGYNNFFCFLSPYEADAQLVLLQKIGLADIIVTIDSDMMLYGPQRVLFRYEPNTRTGEMVDFQGIFSRNLSILGQNVPLLRKTAILSGCDYVKSLKGIGLVTALKAVKQETNLLACCRGLLDKKENPYGSADVYVTQVMQAMFTFQYHLVFNPATGECVNLQPAGQDAALFNFFGQTLGKHYGAEEAIRLCFPTKELEASLQGLQKLAAAKRNVCLIPDLPPLIKELDEALLHQGILGSMGIRYKIQQEVQVEQEKLDPRFKSIQDALFRE